jgi:hypothetical protein
MAHVIAYVIFAVVFLVPVWLLGGWLRRKGTELERNKRDASR